MTKSYYGDKQYTPTIPDTFTGFASGPDGTESDYFTTPSEQAGGPTFRVRAEKLDTGDVLIVAEPAEDVVATLHALELVEIIVSACALVVAAVLGWWLVRRGLRPLVAMERTAESISKGELDERVPGANETTEIGRLARTLNVMLTRIQNAFARERRYGIRAASVRRTTQALRGGRVARASNTARRRLGVRRAVRAGGF